MKKSILFFALCAISLTPGLADDNMPLVKVEAPRPMPVNGNLTVSMHFSIDDLRLGSRQMLAYTPRITDGKGHTLDLPALLVTGRGEHIYYQRAGNKNYPNIMREVRRTKEAQTIDYTYTLPYEAWMKGAWLTYVEDRCGCGRLDESDAYRLNRIDYHPFDEVRFAFLTPAVEKPKVREERGSAYLDFPVNRTEIHPDYRRNPEELAKIIRTVDVVRQDTNVQISRIDIHGYASPEGSYATNDRLARGRAEALKEYVRKLNSMPANLYHSASTPEDWEGLSDRLAGLKLPNEKAIRNLMHTNREPDVRESAIRNAYPDDYRRMLTEIYPALRRADYRVEYVVRPFSLDEARRVFAEKPKQLSLEELFMLGNSYTVGSADYNNVFETAVRLFPNDETANLNAANIALQRRDAEAAERYLAKAGQSPAATHARGLLALLRNDTATAQRLINEAAQAGLEEAKYNLGIIKDQY